MNVNHSTLSKTTIMRRKLLALFALSLFFVSGCADVDIKNLKISISETSFFTENFSVKVTAEVTNNGEENEFKIKGMLSCAEGEWEKTRTYNLRKNETVKVEFLFTEPSVSSLTSDYRARIKASLW